MASRIARAASPSRGPGWLTTSAGTITPRPCCSARSSRHPAARFIVGKPLFTPREWAAAISAGDFTGEVTMRCADGAEMTVQWGAHPEVVTGKRLILLVALSTSRWGSRFRRDVAEGPDAPLTEREREVLALVAEGASGPEIAGQLHISHQTVRTHVRNAMEKVGARSRAHLVAKALGEGQALD